MTANRFVLALRKAARGFIEHRGGHRDLPYFFNMLEEQIREAREHHEKGEHDRACFEVADIIAVAFEALMAAGKNPESFTAFRIESRILPHIAEIERAYGTDGRKGDA